MKTLLINLITGIAVISFGSRAVAAVSLTLEPSPQSINVGDPASMDLVVSGLGNLSPPSLGGFDFDLTFNASVLAANPIVFGNKLNTVPGFGFFTIDNVVGQLHLDEVSLETAAFLNANQPGSFTLATLGFTGLFPGGISGIGFSFASLSDEQGQSVSAFSTTGGSIEVTRRTGIPDVGSTASLLLLGFVSLSALRRFPQAATR
jgi:hypothetical protein